MKNCFVVGCNSSTRHVNVWKDTLCETHDVPHSDRSNCNCPPPIRFFRIPSLHSKRELRIKWLRKINRADPNEPEKIFDPPSWAIVCNKHFIRGCPTACHPLPELHLKPFGKAKLRGQTIKQLCSGSTPKTPINFIKKSSAIARKLPTHESADEETNTNVNSVDSDVDENEQAARNIPAPDSSDDEGPVLEFIDSVDADVTNQSPTADAIVDETEFYSPSEDDDQLEESVEQEENSDASDGNDDGDDILKQLFSKNYKEEKEEEEEEEGEEEEDKEKEEGEQEEREEVEEEEKGEEEEEEVEQEREEKGEEEEEVEQEEIEEKEEEEGEQEEEEEVELKEKEGEKENEEVEAEEEEENFKEREPEQSRDRFNQRPVSYVLKALRFIIFILLSALRYKNKLLEEKEQEIEQLQGIILRKAASGEILEFIAKAKKKRKLKKLPFQPRQARRQREAAKARLNEQVNAFEFVAHSINNEPKAKRGRPRLEDSSQSPPKSKRERKPKQLPLWSRFPPSQSQIKPLQDHSSQSHPSLSPPLESQTLLSQPSQDQLSQSQTAQSHLSPASPLSQQPLTESLLPLLSLPGSPTSSSQQTAVSPSQSPSSATLLSQSTPSKTFDEFNQLGQLEGLEQLTTNITDVIDTIEPTPKRKVGRQKANEHLTLGPTIGESPRQLRQITELEPGDKTKIAWLGIKNVKSFIQEQESKKLPSNSESSSTEGIPNQGNSESKVIYRRRSDRPKYDPSSGYLYY